MSYIRINKSELPNLDGWHVPPQNQGQTIEVAYSSGIPVRLDRSCACYGALYTREIDRADGSTWYGKWAAAK